MGDVISLFCLFIAGVAWAAQPVAHIRSSEEFQLRGVAVPVAGMRSWPLVAGDDIVTLNAPAVILFTGGGKATLAEKSRAKIEAQGTNTILRLTGGSLEYRLTDSAKVQIYNRGVHQTVLAGRITAGGAGAASNSAGARSAQTEALPPLSRWR